MIMEKQKSLVERQIIPKGSKYIPSKWVKILYERIDIERDLCYVMFHIETGLRVTDVVNMKVDRIDWQNDTLTIHDYKKREDRTIPLAPNLRRQIKRWLVVRQNKRVKNQLLFPFSQKTANRILKKWCGVVGFPYADLVSTHWCRHTFIKLSQKCGRDIKLVQLHTGDTEFTLLKWYRNLSIEEAKAEINDKPLIEPE